MIINTMTDVSHLFNYLSQSHYSLMLVIIMHTI